MRRVIAWLEDRPKTVEDVLREAEEGGFAVQLFSKPIQMADFLADSVGAQDNTPVLDGTLPEGGVALGKVVGIVIDIMLFGVDDLLELKIPASDTEGGFEAGWVFLDRYIRDPVRGTAYAGIPVLILSIRRMDSKHKELRDEIIGRGGASVDNVQKFTAGTARLFREWLDNIRAA